MLLVVLCCSGCTFTATDSARGLQKARGSFSSEWNVELAGPHGTLRGHLAGCGPTNCPTGSTIAWGSSGSAMTWTRASSADRAPAPASCAFASQPVQKDRGSGVRSWVWTEPYRPELFQDGLVEGGKRYTDYTKWLNATIPRLFGGLDPFDQRACLKHQRAIFGNVTWKKFDLHDWDIILNGSVGELSAINCVESLLWGVQNKYHPQTESATEFGAYILLDPANTTVKVFLQTGPTLSVPGMAWTDPLLEEAKEEGWTVLTFLHLHPFDASNVKCASRRPISPRSALTCGVACVRGRYQDCAGTCIPSGPDLGAFAVDLQRYGVAQAWITKCAARSPDRPLAF